MWSFVCVFVFCISLYVSLCSVGSLGVRFYYVVLRVCVTKDIQNTNTRSMLGLLIVQHSVLYMLMSRDCGGID
jgi:hypothetical protein